MGKLPDFFLRKPTFSDSERIISALGSETLKPLAVFFKDDYEKRIVGWWEYPGSKFEIRLEPWGALIFQEDTVKVDPWQFIHSDLLSTRRFGIPPQKKTRCSEK